MVIKFSKKKGVKKVDKKKDKNKKECVKCHKVINKDEHYFEVIEYQNNKVLSNKYCHKICQDVYDEAIKFSLGTTKMLSDIGEEFTKMNKGLEKENAIVLGA